MTSPQERSIRVRGASTRGGNLTIYPTDGVSGTFESKCDGYLGTLPNDPDTYVEPEANNPFYEYKNQITSVAFAEGTHTTSLTGMFYSYPELRSVDLSYLDTSECNAFNSLFTNCPKLESVNMGGIDTSKATWMVGMFEGCTSLVSVDISFLRTDRSPDVSRMFANCTSLQSVNLSGVHVDESMSPGYMFQGCDNLREVMTDSATDLDLVFPDGMGGITVVDTSLSTATVTGVDGWTYDATTHTLAPVVRLGDTTLQSGRDYTLGGDVSARAAGDYTLTITGVGYYNGTLRCPYTVARRRVTVAADNKTKMAGERDPALTATVTGMCAGDAIAYRLSRASGETVGTYAITASGDAVQGNYSVEYRGATFRIEASAPRVSYRTHVQRIGWQRYVADGAMSGTSGKSYRLEGINIKLSNLSYSGGIQYRTHVQRIGWQGWRKDDAMAGTKGKSYRLEAIEIKLYGEMAKRYDVYYRVHCQKFGWMGWEKNGQRSGSAGYSRRLEGIQIVLVKKGQPGPGATLKGITQRFSAPFRQKGKK